jgi:hypothetical protein
MYKKKKTYLKTNYKSKKPSTKRKALVSKKSKTPVKKYKTQKLNYKFIQDYRNQLMHPEKYCGKVNEAITLRSSYEILFANWLDHGRHGESEIIKWASENDIIKYYFPYTFNARTNTIVESKKQIRDYYMDFYYVIKDEKGRETEFLVEIKPNKDVKEPIREKYKNPISYIRALFTFQKNQAKWNRTKEYVAIEVKKGRNLKFIIVTEKDLARLKF